MTSWRFCMLTTFEGQNNTQLPNDEEPHLIHWPLLKVGMATDEEGCSSGTNHLSFMGVLITTWCSVVQLLLSSNPFEVWCFLHPGSHQFCFCLVSMDACYHTHMICPSFDTILCWCGASWFFHLASNHIPAIRSTHSLLRSSLGDAFGVYLDNKCVFTHIRGP